MSFVSHDLNLTTLRTSRLNYNGLNFPVDGQEGQVLTVTDGKTASWKYNVAGLEFTLGRASSYSDDLGVGDHIKFDTVIVIKGTDFVLDNSTPYTTATNVPSLGRISLKANKNYLLKCVIDAVQVQSHSTLFSISWYDSDSETALGNEYFFNGIGTSSNPHYNGVPTLYADYCPSNDTKVEVRIMSLNNSIISLDSATFEISVI